MVTTIKEIKLNNGAHSNQPDNYTKRVTAIPRNCSKHKGHGGAQSMLFFKYNQHSIQKTLHIYRGVFLSRALIAAPPTAAPKLTLATTAATALRATK